MTENPCNCSTCPSWSTSANGYCLKLKAKRHRDCCCLLHPKAHEYLNQEVIAELENRKNMLENLEPERGAENWTEMKTLEKVINLLKEGVKK